MMESFQLEEKLWIHYHRKIGYVWLSEYSDGIIYDDCVFGGSENFTFDNEKKD